MSDFTDLLGHIVLNKNFRQQLSDAAKQNKLEEFLKKKGFNLDQQHLNDLKKLDFDNLENTTVADLDKELVEKVGLDPQW
jgi:hypothetical protein